MTRRFGPFTARLVPAKDPSADLELLAAIVGSLALLALALLPLELLSVLAGGCTFKRVTGIPCMTCGTTRSVLAAADGSLALALEMNPLVALGGLLFLAYTPLAWILWLRSLPRPRIGLASRRARWAAAAVVGAAVLANWAFLILDGR